MKKAKNTTAENDEPVINSTPTLDNVLIQLWSVAEQHVSPSQLKMLARADEEAEVIVGSLYDSLEGLACLVASDNDTGNFQSQRDVSQLLFMTVQHLRMIEGLIHISSAAKCYLADPKLHQVIKGENHEK